MGHAWTHAPQETHSEERKSVPAGRDPGVEAAPLDRQGERALDLRAGPHAARADDARGWVVGEVGVRLVALLGQVRRPAEPVAHLGHSDVVRQGLHLAAPAGTPGAVGRVVGQVELHDTAPELLHLLGAGRHDHAVDARRRARGGCALDAVDLDEAHPARPERRERVGRAQRRDVDAGEPGRPQHRRAGGHQDLDAVDAHVRRGVAGDGWRAAVGGLEGGFVDDGHGRAPSVVEVADCPGEAPTSPEKPSPGE